LSRHVDDLLQRQRSLRGQGGVSGSRDVPWYLRSFFTLGVAGLVGAIVAWALIEPVFNDKQYIQAAIEDVSRGQPNDVPRSEMLLAGTITLAGSRIMIPQGAVAENANGEGSPLDVATLGVGQEIGVYVDDVGVGEKSLDVGSIVLLDPPAGERDRRGDLERKQQRSRIAGFFLFAVVAAFVGLSIGAVDGLVCRLPVRALLAGGVGMVVGLLGGLFMTLVAGAIYMPLNMMAQRLMSGGSGAAFGFLLQVAGRGLAWMFAGTAMGLGQGIALRSKKLFVFGLLGGIVGGLMGGLLFDPIDIVLLGVDKPSAHWSRFVGLGVIGASVGVMIGVVELLARDAWLRMTEGPLAGKEFLLFKDVLRIGSSSQSDVYLFNDELVASHHATLRAVGDEYELENHSNTQPVLINGRAIQRSRLRHGDQVTIGRTVFLFQRRKG
jgi:hypothetical protein